MLDVFFLFSRYLSTKNMWSLWFWIMSPNMKPYETFEKLRNKLLFGWSWHLKFSKQWTSLECPMPFCIPVHHVCFGSKINQRKTPFLGYLTSRSTHLEFLFLSVDRVTYLPSYRLVILSYAKKCRHLCCLFPMGLKMSKLAVDTQTVLKTLGFLLQVFFDFSKSLFGGQKFLVIIKPQQTRGSYARLQGGGSSQQCSRVNHIPLWAKKKKSYRGSTQDSFYSEGRYPNVQIWLRDTLRFSVWRKFGGASFVLCYLSSSQLTSFATFSPVKMDDSKNLWRVNPCETRSFFFSKKRHERNFQPSSWFIEPTFKVASLKQPSKLLIQFQPTPQNLYIPKSKGWILTLQNLGGSNSSRSVWGPLHRSTPMSMTVTEREVLRAELQKCHAELAAVKTAKAALAVPWVGNKNPRKISRIYWKQANHHFFRENVLYLFFLMGFFFQGVLLSKF